ncbi:ABC transporter ATP-binding protein [Putridiphycobacter roseus]|uniref:ABC transporter ATP-binding protein n=1 Tax=Putridiphycobacter roseus TaxID=2219161 RepID=A0A2W1N344_9FLAO|nr:ABC transporter ATP-binding protein [Putridiphycobacter roseus]PZE18294.1 ABC transporter ATP-binding protein [Putridiphycobacter roseus]
MGRIALKTSNLSKQYRLGQVGTGTISHDLNRFFSKLRGKEDPYLQVTGLNDRSVKNDSDYIWALKDVSFEVEEGDVLGIIGKNGAGKSTLLKLLSRITSPTQGSIQYNGRITSLLEVGTGFHQELTGRENIYLNGAILGMSKKEISKNLDEIISFSGCSKYIDTPVKRYSSGMIVRLGFSVAAHLESEMLIVDEVLAVGDVEFQKKCIGKMQDISGTGRTVLFVSHNMNSVEQLCNKAILLENGTIVSEGKTTDIIREYQASNVVENYKLNKNKQNQSAYFEEIEARHEGSKLIISAQVISQESIRNLTCGFLLKDNWNQKVGTIFERINLDQTKNKVEVVIDISNLLAGSYQIDGSLFVPKVINYEYIENGVSIEINNGNSNIYEGQNIGAMKLNAKWSVN